MAFSTKNDITYKGDIFLKALPKDKLFESFSYLHESYLKS